MSFIDGLMVNSISQADIAVSIIAMALVYFGLNQLGIARYVGRIMILAGIGALFLHGCSGVTPQTPRQALYATEVTWGGILTQLETAVPLMTPAQAADTKTAKDSFEAAIAQWRINPDIAGDWQTITANAINAINGVLFIVLQPKPQSWYRPGFEHRILRAG